MPQKHTRAYPADFRHKIVELARAGRGADDLADEFKLAKQTVRNWIKQADRECGRRSDGLTTAENEELAKLRKENRQLKTERDILSKAAVGSLARPIRYPQSLRIRESASGHVARRDAMPCSGCLFQRLLRMA